MPADRLGPAESCLGRDCCVGNTVGIDDVRCTVRGGGCRAMDPDTAASCEEAWSRGVCLTTVPFSTPRTFASLRSMDASHFAQGSTRAAAFAELAGAAFAVFISIACLRHCAESCRRRLLPVLPPAGLRLCWRYTPPASSLGLDTDNAPLAVALT